MRSRTRPTLAAPPAKPLPWRRDPTIAKLTGEILSLQTSTCNFLSDRLVEIGERLRAARDHLAHGEWMDWLDTAVPFDPASAKNYMKLAEFARTDRSDYRRLRHLGPSKLYLILALPPQRRRRLPLDRPLSLPGNRRKTLEIMSVPELASHLGDLALPPAPATPIAKVVQAYRFRVAALSAATTELAERSREIDAALARELHDELRTVLSTLSDAFDL